MITYSIEITDESADYLVRDIIKSSINTIINLDLEDDDDKLTLDSLINVYNYFSPRTEQLTLEDFENDV